MHIRMKKQLQNILNTLQNIHSKLQALTIDERMVLLENCQKAAIVVGENIEKGVIEDPKIIPLLEEYCEKIYMLSQVDEITSVHMNYINSFLCVIREHIYNLSEKYRVVFLPYKDDMWDSLESIWRAFSKDARCECDVVPIPYFEANSEEKKWEPRYDGARFPKDVPVTSFEYYRLEEMQPDIAFIHNPYDNCNYITSVHPAFYSDELKKNVKKLVYVPYYANTGFIAEDFQQLPVCAHMDYMIVQSELAKESCKGKNFYDKILPLGSPKFDNIMYKTRNGVQVPDEWEKVIEGKKTLMLNTTINDILNNEQKLLDKLKHFFEMVKSKNDVAIIWRPHPLLSATVKAMRPQLYEGYEKLVQYFVENKVGILDTTGDVSNTVVIAGGYIGSSYSSVVNLFTVSGKPVFLFDSQVIYEKSLRGDENPEEFFDKKSLYDYFACRETKQYTVDDFIEDFANDALAQVRKRQLEAVSDIAANLDGTCGEKVYEYMMNVLLNEEK